MSSTKRAETTVPSCSCGERCWRVGGEAACASVLPPDVFTGPLRLQLSDEEARVLHHAISTTLSLIEQVGDIPQDAPLYGARPTLIKVAQRLSHERRWKGTATNPHEVGG